MTKYVAYYRVSTQKQGASGLGLEGQKAAVKQFTKSCDNCVIGEFVEVESGKKNNRKELEKAMQLAKKENAVLLVAKLDRLSRNAEFLFSIQNANVKFLCCDNPQATDLTIGILAVVAQDEAKRISERTKAALKAKVARLEANGENTNWRNNEKQTWSNDARVKAKEALKAKKESNENTNRAKGYAQILRNSGNTLEQVANILNKQGFKTANNKEFSKATILRLIK